MFYPYNPKTNKVYDLTRSTYGRPYEMHYSTVPNCECKKFNCLLPENEQELRTPFVILTIKQIRELIDFSSKALPDFNTYQLGYKTGFTDATVSFKRITFCTPTYHTLSFIVGYELGIYLAMWFRDKKKNVKTPPELSYFLQRPSRSMIMREYFRNKN